MTRPSSIDSFQKLGSFGQGSYAMLPLAATVRSCHNRTRARTRSHKSARDFQKTLLLSSGQSFRIETNSHIRIIHGESAREVKISATIRTAACTPAAGPKFR